jgi:hypothetical protein
VRDPDCREPDGRSGVLLLRVWTEEAGERFRARISSLGADSSDQAVAVAADPDRVIEMIRDWLGQFTGPGCPQSRGT